MPTLDKFLNELQEREGHTDVSALIHTISKGYRTILDREFSNISKQLVGKKIKSLKNNQSSNQSKGSSVEKFIAKVLTSYTSSRVQFSKPKGAGYPDLQVNFVKHPDAVTFLEIKATSKWDPKDSNRRVLFSSSNKMKRIKQSCKANICFHVVITAVYSPKSGEISFFRIDFLQPNSKVNIRLEASTSHRLLSSSSTHSRIFR